jgi:nucleotide-binding universal stress UspA family protein
MTIRLILAPLTGGKRDALTLANAFAAAAPLDAHVRALFVRPDPTEALPFFGDEVAPAMAGEIVEAAREAADAASAAAQTALSAAAAVAEFETVEKPEDAPSASFFEMKGHFADCVARAGQLCDLIVFGPQKESDRLGLTEAFEAALLKSGAPVLLGSEAQPREFARIAIGWNASAASAHAVRASLPYLEKAEAVQIVTVQGTGIAEPDIESVKDYLLAHGIEAEILRAEPQSRSVGDVLLQTAVSNEADLLVLGGYGHSRLREWLAGGVTRQILSQATLPLFLVH